MFLSRIDFQDFDERKVNKNLEMVWSGNNNLGKSNKFITLDISSNSPKKMQLLEIIPLTGFDGKLFTGVLFDHYAAPRGFCFDEKTHRGCHDESISGISISRIIIFNIIHF